MSELVLIISAILWGLAAGLLGWRVLNSSSEAMANYRATFTESASDNLSDMFVFIDPGKIFYINMLALVLSFPLVWLVTGSLLMGAGASVIVWLLPQWAYRRLRRMRLQRFMIQLPDGLAMLSGSMQAGASLNMALEGLVKEQPAPMSQEFELLIREQRIGVDMEDALQHMEARIKDSDFSMVITALLISREVGGNLAEVLDTLADTLRRKLAMEDKVNSLTAQGRMQGIVMALLPILLGAILMFIEPEAMGKMFTTVPGYFTVAFIVIWEAIGFVFINRITSVDI
ncbi:MAG: type II secretion system F family protein [Gammaproteobacteria bacterium]